MSAMQSSSNWQGSETEIFWGELSPCEHLVQLYEDNVVFLDLLEGMVVGGILAGDGVLVLATSAHLELLDDRLRKRGVDIEAARSRDQYISLDAEESLTKFMVSGWPDDRLFGQFVAELLRRARKDGRRVRAFGELVAVLWARGESGATVRLEHLWHELCETEVFSLFCAYPRIGFTQDASVSIQEICATHTKVIGGFGSQIPFDGNVN